jgi:hypothetical protein
MAMADGFQASFELIDLQLAVCRAGAHGFHHLCKYVIQGDFFSEMLFRICVSCHHRIEHGASATFIRPALLVSET